MYICRKIFTLKYKYTNEQLKEAVLKSLSLSQVCRELGIRPAGGNFKILRCKIESEKIDISHFTGQAWNVGIRYRPIKKLYKLEDILIENSLYRSSSKLKARLIKEGLKEAKCEICNNSKWLDKDINLEIHHINGINTDNRIENLQVLCPNCHSYTDNFRGKNQKKSALSEKREVEYRKFKEALTEDADGNLEPSLKNKEGAETLHGKPKAKKVSSEKTCSNCEIKFTRKSGRFCSVECYRIYNSKNRPSVIELIETITRLDYNLVQVGRHYNVSDSAVRKWCILYKILDMVKKKSRPQINGDIEW